MASDIPAEFLPALPSNRNRASVGVKDARVEAMMAAMQQRPTSVRRESDVNPPTRSRGPSVADQTRPPSFDRPLSMRSTASDRPPVVLATEEPSRTSYRERPRLELSNPGGDRPSSIGSIPLDRARAGSSFSSTGDNYRSIRVTHEDIPIAMAEVESGFNTRRSKSNGGLPPLPPIARVYDNEAGNRSTMTFSDEELARRLHEQLNGLAQEDGQIVTAEIVQAEVMDRRQAEMLLDQEIANLESAVLARQLQGGEGIDDDGAAEDEAFRNALANNDKLDYMRPESHKPIFSALIFLTCFVTMIAEIGVNKGIEPFSANPTFGPKPEVLLLMGAKRSDLILAGDYYRLVAPIILHAGILHLLFNMLGLWNIGVPMEREFGTWRIGLIFVLSGLFGVLMSCLFAPKLTSVGASGAIFGLFGAAWADLIQNWSLYKGTQIRMLIQLFLMTAFNVVLGLMPFLDNFAHLGGMICGCTLGLLILVQTRYYYSGVKKRKRAYQIALMVCSFFALPGIFVAAYVVFFLRIPLNCNWCSYISCVPMPPNVAYSERWWSCDECSQGGLTGDIEPANNTLIFTCPNNGLLKSKSFPQTTNIDANVLIQTCIDMCLS